MAKQVLLVLVAALLCTALVTAKPSGKRRVQELENEVGGSTSGLVYELMDKMQRLTDEVDELKRRQNELLKREYGPVEILDKPITKIVGPSPLDCQEALIRQPLAESGLYYIKPRGVFEPIPVYCDMDSDGGGWTLLQRRQDGSEDFNRNWHLYTRGFGSLSGEFWLGNEFIHILTKQYNYKLRVELTGWEGQRLYAEYSDFSIGSLRTSFKLRLGEFLGGNATDALSYHNKKPFTTIDNDNDDSDSINCAVVHNGGWWFKSCDRSNLNGLYYHSPQYMYQGDWDDGIEWKETDGSLPFYSYKATEMKIRRMD
ncbi:ficolin-1-like [Patiria miniata]|uniref:Fibrinogen C-terminal domain-containing protein n=1 Tax=Patiria miniata TaxID=46514 RepID=A0A913Z7P3_PATMI|nr:ficolin-1-like [Patiria miniata]